MVPLGLKFDRLRAGQCIRCPRLSHRSPRALSRRQTKSWCGVDSRDGRDYKVDMRMLVLGDRCLECRELATTILRRLLARYGPDIVIIHGGESGVDESFSAACQELGLTTEVRLANWHRTGLPTVRFMATISFPVARENLSI
jgi:hypothetical protein